MLIQERFIGWYISNSVFSFCFVLCIISRCLTNNASFHSQWTFEAVAIFLLCQYNDRILSVSCLQYAIYECEMEACRLPPFDNMYMRPLGQLSLEVNYPNATIPITRTITLRTIIILG